MGYKSMLCSVLQASLQLGLKNLREFERVGTHPLPLRVVLAGRVRPDLHIGVTHRVG